MEDAKQRNNNNWANSRGEKQHGRSRLLVSTLEVFLHKRLNNFRKGLKHFSYSIQKYLIYYTQDIGSVYFNLCLMY